MEDKKATSKRKKTGGRKKGTPNKLSKKVAREIIEKYFFTEIDLDGSIEKTTRFEQLIIELEDIAFNSSKDAIRLKAMNIIIKALGLYNTSKELEIENKDNKINIRIIDN